MLIKNLFSYSNKMLYTRYGDEIFIDTSGNVGLGKNNSEPSYPLDVSGSIYSSGQYITDTSLSPFIVTSSQLVNNLNVQYLNSQESNYYLNASNINTGVLDVGYGGIGTNVLGQNNILIGNSSSNVLSASGLIWSNNKLDISGNLNVSESALFGDISATNINFTGGLYQNGILFESGQWEDGSDNKLYYNLGNVGIGTSNPTRTLDISGDLIVNNFQVRDSWFIAEDLSSVRNQLQLQPILKLYYLSESQNIFNDISLNGYYDVLPNNVGLYLNGTKLLYYDNANKEYDITVNHIDITITTISITLYTPTQYGDILDVTIFPTFPNDVSTRYPGYVYQVFNQVFNNASGIGTSYTYANVGIGTNIPTQNLDVSGNALIRDTLYATNVDFSGNLYQNGQLYISSQWTTDNSNNTLYYNDGNVGIGTNYATNTLDVSGSALIRNTLYATNVDFSDNLYQNGQLYISSQWTTDNSNNTLYYNDGNVGIGTNYATNTLDVSGNTLIRGHILPGTDITYDLGSSSKRWRDIYLSGSTIDLSGALIKRDASGIILVNSNNNKLDARFNNIYLDGNISAAGNLSVLGTLTTINSIAVTVQDPIITLGLDTPTSNDGKDRGIEFLYYNGSVKQGFFGFDNSSSNFVYLLNASNSNEVLSGTYGNIQAGSFISSNTSGAPFTVSSSSLVTNLNADLLDSQEGTFYLNWNNFDNIPNLLNTFNNRTGNVTLTAIDISEALTYVPLNETTYNASDILAKLITVDGSGSQLDADFLDGENGMYYRNMDNVNNGTLKVEYGGTGNNSLTSGKLLVGAGTNSILTPTNLTWNGSNLGIGSLSPSQTLDVSGNASFTGDINVSNVFLTGDISASNAYFVDISASNVFLTGDISASNAYLVDISASNVYISGNLIAPNLVGNSSTTTQLAVPRNIQLSGDISGNVLFDGTSDVTITTIIQPNSIELGVDTSGNYISTIIAGTDISITGSGTENANVTIDNTSTLQTITNRGNTTTQTITAPQFISNTGIGTAPFIVTSSTLVTNLNADLLDGLDSTYYLDATNTTGILSVSQGGIGTNNLTPNKILVGNGTNNILSPVDITWDGSQLEVSGNIIPSNDSIYDLGSSTKRWKDIYLSGNTIDLSGALIKRDASGIILVNSNNNKLDARFNNIYLDGNISAGGNLSVLGTLTTINSIAVTVQDPIITLGLDTPTSNDGKDRGIEFLYYNGSIKQGFFGFDNSSSNFVYLLDASNNNEIFSGTYGGIQAGSFISSNTSGAPFTVSSSELVTNLNVDLLDSQDGTYYLNWNNFSNIPNLVNTFNNRTGNVTLTATDISEALTYVPLNETTYNASDILAKLITVDGSGSQLDADFLDGENGMYYRNMDNVNNGTLKVEYGGTGNNSLTSGKILVGDGTSAILTPINLTWNGSNLGIGSLSPSQTLDVSGNISASNAYFNGDINTINIDFSGDLYKNGQLYISSQWSDGSNNNLYYNIGNVGIGSNDPSQALDVSGNISAFNALFSGTVNATNIDFSGDLYKNGQLYISSQWVDGSYNNLYYNTGNIGIGTNNPSQQLDISGTMIVDNFIVRDEWFIANDTPYTRTQLQIQGTTQTFNITSNNTTTFDVSLNGQYRLDKPQDVHVHVDGIKLGYISASLNDYQVITSLYSTYTNFTITLNIGVNIGNVVDIVVYPRFLSEDAIKEPGYVYQVFNSPWDISNNNAYYNSGNVGIGSISPSQALDVSGNIAASGNISAGNFVSCANINFSGSLYKDGVLYVGSQWIDGSSNSLYYNTGNIGIGTSNPQAKLDVSGNVKATTFTGSGASLTSIPAASLTGTVSVANGGTGNSTLTSNKVLVGNSVSGILQPTNLHWDNTNSRLGVGIVTPATTLDIYHATGVGAVDTSAIGLKLNSSSGGGVIYANDINHSIFLRVGRDGTSDTTNYYQFGAHRFYTGGVIQSQTERMRITSGGNIGIGVTGPTEKLEVSGNVKATSFIGNASTATQLQTSRTIFGQSFNGTANVTGDITPNGKIVVQNAQDGGTSRGIYMWQASDANWGIYMSQPGATKSLGGSTAVAGHDFGSYAIRSRAYNTNTNGFIWENSSEVLLMSLNAGTGNLFITGNIGIGNTNPQAKLDVSGTIFIKDGTATNPILAFSADTNTGFYRPGNDILGFVTGGIERLRINANGNLGIGTTLPFKALDVSGGINFTDNLYKNGQLYVSSQWLDDTNNIYYNIGNVGIGTNNPQEKLDISGNTLIRGHVLPGTNISYDLGSSTKRWRDIYLSGNTIDISGALIKRDASGIILVNINDNTLDARFNNIRLDGNIAVGGNLSVLGTLTTINSTVVTVQDPIITLGLDTPTSNDGKDRGIEFLYYNGSVKQGFFGFDNTSSNFVYLLDATNTNEILSGTYGGIQAGSFISSNTSGAPFTVSSSGLVTNLNTDLLDSQDGTYYLNWNNFSNIPNLVNTFNNRTGNVTLTATDISEALTYVPLNQATYNASDILAKLITVDGSGSQLNADFLDGQNGLYYRNMDNVNNGTLKVEYGGTGNISLTSGKLLVGNGTNAILTPTNLTWNGSNLGIGSSNPSYQLDVSGGINFTDNLYKNGQLYISSQWVDGSDNSLYYNTGNIGIGSNNPSYQLDVSGGINFTDNLYKNGQLYISSQWVDGSDNSLYYNTGNVGIGTNYPIADLDISGDLLVRGNFVDINGNAKLFSISNYQSWSPEIISSISNPIYSVNISNFRYNRTGYILSAEFVIDITLTSIGNGIYKITLPQILVNNVASTLIGSGIYTVNDYSYQVSYYVDNGTNLMEMRLIDGAVTHNHPYTNDVGTVIKIAGSISYECGTVDIALPSYNYPMIMDSSGNVYMNGYMRYLSTQTIDWIPYLPIVTSTINPSLDGEILGKYVQLGKTLTYQGVIDPSNNGLNTGSGIYYFSLPLTGAVLGLQDTIIGTAQILDKSSNVSFTMNCVLLNSTPNVFYMVGTGVDNGVFSNTYPLNPITSSIKVTWNITYETELAPYDVLQTHKQFLYLDNSENVVIDGDIYDTNGQLKLLSTNIPYISHTPIIKASITDPTVIISNGNQYNMRYNRVGNTIIATFTLQYTHTTTGSGIYQFTLPQLPLLDEVSEQLIGTGMMIITTTNTSKFNVNYILSDSGNVTVVIPDTVANFTNTHPYTIGVGTVIKLYGMITYETLQINIALPEGTNYALSMDVSGNLFYGNEMKYLSGNNLIWKNYEPYVSANISPVFGSGNVVTGRYTQIGKTVTYQGYVNAGTVGLNPGSGTYYITLPVPAYQFINNDSSIGTAYITDTETDTTYSMTCILLGNDNNRFYITGGSVNNGRLGANFPKSPFNSYMRFSWFITYEATVIPYEVPVNNPLSQEIYTDNNGNIGIGTNILNDKFVVDGNVQLGKGIFGSGNFYKQITWDISGSSHIISYPYYCIGQNSSGTLMIQISNNSIITPKIGNMMVSFIKPYGENVDIFVISSHNNDNLEILTITGLGNNIQVNTDSDCSIAWSTIGAI